MQHDLILLGGGQSKAQCPFDAEVWAVATLLLDPDYRDKPYSKIFAFDSRDLARVRETLNYAQERRLPIVSTHNYASEPYPIWDIIREFNCNYFKPTASYMLALAIFRGYQKIYLYGIDHVDSDYLVNRSYVTFWLGVAMGRGIHCILAPGSLDWIWAGGKQKEKYLCMTM